MRAPFRSPGSSTPIGFSSVDASELAPASDFLQRSLVGLFIVSLVMFTPFAVNNFVQGRPLLGTGALAIVVVFAFNAWTITRRGRYYPLLILLILVPTILAFLTLSLLRQGVIGALWCYPAVVSFYFMLPERWAWIANAALLVIAAPLTWILIEPPLAIRIVATLSMLSVFSIIFIRVITEQQDLLRRQAVVDPLTGLFNRTLLDGTLERTIAQSERSELPMTLLAIDIDSFKAINDSLGHDIGDRVLQGVAALLGQRLRRTDRAFRLGGEEFLVLLYGVGGAEGRRVGEQLRAAVAALDLLEDRQVTISVGVATLEPGEARGDWLKRSDENLYRAKEEGRDRVAS